MSTGVVTVGDVMTSAVVSAHSDAVFKQIVDAMSRNRVSIVPVVDADHHVLGVVSASDLLSRLSGDRGETPRGHRLTCLTEQRRKKSGITAEHLMTCPAITVAATATVRAAARHAARHHVRCMPVVDENDVLVGIVSRSDLLKPYLRPDAELKVQIEDQVISERLLLDPFGLSVSVADGVVTLRGFVERRSEADQLRSTVAELSGVVSVNDKVTYGFDDLATRSPVPRPL